jgi:hypothetical protein
LFLKKKLLSLTDGYGHGTVAAAIGVAVRFTMEVVVDGIEAVVVEVITEEVITKN